MSNKQPVLKRYKIREKSISDYSPFSTFQHHNWSKISYLAYTKEEAFSYFKIKEENQIYYEIMEIPYSGKREAGTRFVY